MTDPPTEHALPEPRRRAGSIVLVNTGDGKGKSTAAFGVRIRGVARGWPVADTVTEMRKLKHAYDSGVVAKPGIDY